MKQQVHVLFVLALIMLLAAGCSAAGLIGGSNSQPGEGVGVRMARATWDTSWFQAEIFRSLLEELGYEVRDPIETLDNLPAYFFIAQGDIDFWTEGWFPQHERYFDYSKVKSNAAAIGYQVKNGALQGYMVDKATAEEIGMTNLGDLADPETAAIFDHDGDGKADLLGCDEGWSCDEVIEEQLDAYGLRSTVTHVQGNYSELILETVERYEAGQPVLFYNWTPNWTVSRMSVGEDIAWLSVPFSVVPGEIAPDTAVDSIPGCLESPCDMGFEPSDIRVVANVDFLSDSPAAAALFELVEIPLADIAAQNVLLADGENSDEAIRRHAQEWIEANRDSVDPWLEAARLAAER